MKRRVRWLAGLACAVLALAACSDSADVVTVHTGLEADVVEELDSDGDGIVSQEALNVAVHESLEAAARSEIQAAQDAREEQYQALLADSDAVAASISRAPLLVGDVRANLVASPITQMDDPQKPTHEEFVSRLTSMINLRLVGRALTDFGFPVDLSADESEIGAQVRIHVNGEFEEFAQAYVVEEDPRVERVVTPHCVSLLALGTQADAAAAIARVEAGESFGDVADEVNLPGFTGAAGVLGCGLPFDLLGSGEPAQHLFALEPGGLTEPLSLPSSGTPDGVLWAVFRLDSLDTDATDLASIGPFAEYVLSQVIPEYEVSIAPEIGSWDVSTLAVAMPALAPPASSTSPSSTTQSPTSQ